MRTRYQIILTALIALSLVLGAGCTPAKPVTPLPTPPPPLAQFEVASVDIKPVEAVVGETVSIAAVVKNIGDSKGIYAAILTVDGVTVETKEVAITPSSSRVITFSLVKDAPGTYEIGVGDLSSSLTVVGKTPVTYELKHDDGTSSGFCSCGGRRGYLVGFSPPVTPFSISEVRLFASLVGTGYEQTKPELEIWNKDSNVQHICEVPYTRFSLEPSWVIVEIPSITVNDDFCVVFYTNSTSEGGAYIHFDSSVINKHSELVADGQITNWFHKPPKETTNWMIRVVGTATTALAPTPTTDLSSDLYNLPEIKDGISSQEAEAIDKVKYLCQSSDPEVQQGLQLIGEYGIPPNNGGRYMPVYPIPDYNTQLQVLFWLALDEDIDEDYDRIAIALALDYGVVVTYGDNQVDAAVKQYVCQVYDYVRDMDKFLVEKNVNWQAKGYPLEADMLLVWGACGMRYPTFYDQVGQTGKTPWTHFWYIEFEERHMTIEDFNWLFVSIETLREMRDWTVRKGFAVGDTGKVADNIDTYAGKHTHYYTDKPDVPPSYMKVEGKITPGCRLSNPDWQWGSLKEKGEFLGNCEDALYMGCMLLKSLNIAVGVGNVQAEGFGHAVILYYNVEDDVLRTTPNQLDIIERHTKEEIAYRYYHIPWDNLHQRENSILVTKSSDSKILEKGISTEYILKWR